MEFREYLFEVEMIKKIQTDKKIQGKLIKYFQNHLNAKIIKSSRGGQHLRTQINGDFEPIFQSIGKFKFDNLEKTISGSFPTYVITTLKKIDKIPKGSKILYVNSQSKTGVINNKEFTPDSLGFAGKRFTAGTLKREMLQTIRNHPKYKQVGAFIEELIFASCDNKKKIKNTLNVSGSDINKIAKDFGELTGVLWLLNNKYKNAKVYFPITSNEPLIDYVIEFKDGSTIKISAKAGKGAPPSINIVADILKENKIKLSQEEKRLSQTIIDISDNTTIQGILEASATLNTPGYKELKKLLKVVSRETIEHHLSQFNTWDEAKESLSDFYKATKRSASDKMGERIYHINWPKRRDGLIISPLGYHLVDVINNIPELTNLLNKVLSSISVEQLYLNTDGKSLKYNLVPFKEGNFLFHYNANAGEPSLKKISFKMKN